jgi:RNA recognition motif-containing protein
MGNKLYVGNLPFSATDDSLREMFAQSGQVESARIITDRDTGRSKGFGFVEMSNEHEASDAIQKFNGKEVDGRSLTVNEARPMVPRDGGGGGGRGGRDGGGGGRGHRGGGGGGGGRQRW